MVKYSCMCLNLLIETNVIDEDENRGLEDKIVDARNLLPFPIGHSIRHCKTVLQQTALIESKFSGPWNVFKCLNCATYTHAEINDGVLIVYVNSMLRELSDQELITVKQSINFSPVFNVVITNHSCVIDITAGPSHSIGDFSNVIISDLKSHLIQKVDDQKEKTDARIKQFIREQESALREYILRANDDFQNVKNVILNHYAAKNTLVSAADNDEKEIKIDEFGNKQVPVNTFGSGSSQFGEVPVSLDSEGLFFLDDIDVNNVPNDEEQSEDEEQTDTDDSGSRDEGIHIPRREKVAFAKSLPINVHTDFSRSYRYSDDCLDDFKRKPSFKEKMIREKPVDIAASMKALANSVHGDAIFGDLPPPRIGSRI